MLERISGHIKKRSKDGVWITKLDGFLTLNDREILGHAGRVSHDLAKQIAEHEYDVFHQKRLEAGAEEDGDFEKAVKQIESSGKNKKSRKKKS